MATLTVGKGQRFTTIAAAVNASRDGDVVAVDAGVYVDDFVTVNTRITIQGVGGMVELVAAHAPPNGKGIFVTNTDVTLDRLAFSGAAVPDGNGAGVRYQGGNLTILNSYFHDNQNGLLANASATGTITIRGSEFSHNGAGDGYTHNLYVGEIASLTIDRSYFHDAVVGHEIKSRAHATTITNSRILDGDLGTASYSVDLPNGGRAVLSGNLIGQGPRSENPAIVHFGGEGAAYGGSSLQMTGNTVVNDLASGSARLVANQTGVTAEIAGTKVIGLSAGQMASGPASVSGSVPLPSRPALDTSSPWAGTGTPAPTPPPAPIDPPPAPTGGSTTVGSGADSLILKVSEQAWRGHAQFTVTVDGAQVGGTFTAKADHASNVSDSFILKGNWGTGAHAIEVNFVNDAWNGNLQEDRNLYLDAATYNGKALASGVVPLLSGGPVWLNVPSSAPPPITPPPVIPPPTAPAGGATTIGAGKDVLVVKVSEQAWNGDAQFTVTVDGVRVGGVLTATASHAQGRSDVFTLKGDWGSGAHKVEVDFVNDAWNGNLAEDRNLHVDGISYNGAAVPSSVVDMRSGGAVAFSVPSSAITGDASNNRLTGTAGADHLRGLGGDDTLLGGAGNDTLDGGAGADLMIGGAGNDAFVVDDAGDVVTELAGGGYDRVTSGLSYRLGANLERLDLAGAAISATGNELDNLLIGNNLANVLVGMAGKDVLQGGGGKDTLIGGAGADSFRFVRPSEGGDAILDFVAGQDIVEISAGGFGGGLSAATALAGSGRFILNTSGLANAPAGVGQFVYETDAAKLWWDADGAGAGAATEIATFAPGTMLGAGDIQLIG